MATTTLYGASVRPRGRTDGTAAFDVRFRLNGSSRTRSFDSEIAATRWANVVKQIGPIEALKMLETGGATTVTVNEYAEQYIASKSGVEPKTLEDYRTYMRLSISPAMGELPLDAVLDVRIAQWVNSLADEGMAAKTIKNRHGFLAGMFQTAHENGLITKNPCAHTRLPETEQIEMVFLTPEEYLELLSYIPLRWQPLVILLAATGMRWGEATALRPSDFDFSHGTVRVSRAWKSSRSRGWYLGAPKTKKSKRTISLPGSIMPMLVELAAEVTEFMFENAEGRPVRQAKFYEGVWAPARRLANGLPAFAPTKGATRIARTGGVWDVEPSSKPIKKMPRVHDLRHSHAFWLIRAGHPLAVVQQRLGHESIQTTSDTYGHLSPDMLNAAAASIDTVLTGGFNADTPVRPELVLVGRSNP